MQKCRPKYEIFIEILNGYITRKTNIKLWLEKYDNREIRVMESETN